MPRLIDFIKKILKQVTGEKGEPVKKQKAAVIRLVVLAMIGVALLLGNRMLAAPQTVNQAGSSPAFSSTDAKKLSEINSDVGSSSATSISKYEDYVNQSLKNILEQIQGVSEVSVMTTFSSTEKSIYQNDVKTQDNQTVESDPKGGKRQINQRSQDSQVVMIDKNGVKEPVVIGKEQPTVRGVIVVANGADQPAIRAEIMQAVSTVMDIPTYQVKVLQKNE
ncbi:stage III sporulation protein AG [Sporolactobacillus pectinivorans]|uniref:stage III sporulation protein AG n=1 Tax=Sporolactobacillus pectinivorans TaxID=1591408 RepID=UPI001EFE1561|nr:stage III sporulation protein AG [Sporolactobacillus pectinivorans]